MTKGTSGVGTGTREFTEEEQKRMMEDVWDSGDWCVEISQPRWQWGSPEILIAQRHPAKTAIRYATGLIWSEPFTYESDYRQVQETFRLPRQATQDLFDQMWGMGFRPSDPKGALDAQTHDALKAHLVDMRSLALHVLMPMIKERWDGADRRGCETSEPHRG